MYFFPERKQHDVQSNDNNMRRSRQLDSGRFVCTTHASRSDRREQDFSTSSRYRRGRAQDYQRPGALR